MKKAKHLSYIAFLSLMLASCSVDGSGESLSPSEESEPASSLDASSQSVDDVSVPGDSAVSSSRSSRERNPFSIRGDSTYYTVSFYQSYYIKRGDDGEPVYGNPRFDFSMGVKAGQYLYDTMDGYSALLSMCHPSYHPNGDAYSVYGFYRDETCQRSIGSHFKVNSNMNVYYYCEG